MARLSLWKRLFVHVKPAVKRREGASGRRALSIMAFVAACLSPAPAFAGDSALPANLNVPADLRRHLERLLELSPTFRAQCDLLRRTPRVRVTIAYDRRRSSFIDAETVFEKHEFGFVVVTTTLFVPGDMTELVAHELEHVCEQIEGVHLQALAHEQPEEVHEFGGRYETRRATLAGRRAAQEFRASVTTPAELAVSVLR